MAQLLTQPVEMVYDDKEHKFIVSPSVGELQAGAGALAPISGMSIMGVPVGEAAAGLLIAGLGDTAITIAGPLVPSFGVGANIRNALLLFLAAWLVQSRPVKGFVGPAAADAGSLLLAADWVLNVFNVRRLLPSLLSGVKLGGATSGGGAPLAGPGAFDSRSPSLTTSRSNF